MTTALSSSRIHPKLDKTHDFAFVAFFFDGALQKRDSAAPILWSSRYWPTHSCGDIDAVKNPRGRRARESNEREWRKSHVDRTTITRATFEAE